MAHEHPPEPLSLNDPPRGSAGPINSLPTGWPLETLGKRIVDLQGRPKPVYTGRTVLPKAQFEAALQAANTVSNEQRVNESVDL